MGHKDTINLRSFSQKLTKWQIGKKLVSEPAFGILGRGTLPQFEVEKVLSAYAVHRAHHLAGSDTLANFYRHALELAVEGEICAMVNQDALVVAGQHDNLGDFSVEHGFGLCIGADGQCNTVVLG